MNILSYVKYMDGCTYHRVHLPHKYIDANVRTTGNLSEEDLAWCDLLVYSRHTTMSPVFLDQMRKKHNFKIVVDTDDWWEAPPEHPKYEFFRTSNTGLQIRQHLMYADAVITTHERLAREIPNPNVYVIPNMLPYGDDQFKLTQPKPTAKVRLLYASTIMNYYNARMIAGAMKRLAGLPIEVVIAGYHDSPYYTELIQNLTAGVIPYRTIPTKPVDEYMSAYEGDILIVPSKPTKFNSMKSNLKVLEAAVIGVPAVVAKCDPYLDLPVDYFKNENEFVAIITKLVQDEQLRKDHADRVREYCLKHNLKDHAKERLKIYEVIQRSDSNSR